MHEGGWVYFEDYSVLGFTWPNGGITEISLKSKNENIYSEFEKFMSISSIAVKNKEVMKAIKKLSR